MKNRVQKFLTAEERQTIETTVKEAEASTSGEIVVMAVGESSNYPEASIAASGAIALLLAIVVALLLRNENMWIFLALFAGFFIVSHEVVKRIAVLKRLFVNHREMVEEVEDAAISAFCRHKVHETKDRTGILIYISLFEHQVHVLADTGIDALVDRAVWQELIDTITQGIHDGRQCESICAAVKRCGTLLQERFPRKPEDRNELNDAMIIG